MYISVCHVSYIVVVMFTCTLVRSHPKSRRRKGETWTVVINSYTQGEAWQQDACSQEGARAGFSIHPERGYEGRIREVKKKTAVQVCTLTIAYYCSVTVKIHAIATYATFRQWATFDPMHVQNKSLTVTLTGVYFLQVKNKPWNLWVYSWFWHRREQ